jgi:hypothetical protein
MMHLIVNEVMTIFASTNRIFFTPPARHDPSMAWVMNNSPKMVFSKTLQNVEEGPNWKNIKLFHEIKPEEIIKLKGQEGKGFHNIGQRYHRATVC